MVRRRLGPTPMPPRSAQSRARTLALMLDSSFILAAQVLTPDPWQRDLLLCSDRQVLLNCTRSAGKSRTVEYACCFLPI